MSISGLTHIPFNLSSSAVLTIIDKSSLGNILDVLGQEGISKVLIEGGAELLSSFKTEDLIDEMHIYTSISKLDNATLRNPLVIDKGWNITEELKLGDDNLVIATRKTECLQES